MSARRSSTGIGFAVVSALSPSYGDPFTIPFRSSLLLVFLTFLVPLEFRATALSGLVFRSIRGTAEAH